MKIGIIGGGPSSLFMLKRIVEAGQKDVSVEIFERKEILGAGMPYSHEGSCPEHITNVSGNEIPEIFSSMQDWLRSFPDVALKYGLKPDNFSDFKVLPRLLFGEYLSYQFQCVITKAKEIGIAIIVYYRTEIVDIIQLPDEHHIKLIDANHAHYHFEKVVICSGHHWPKQLEGIVPGYYESPYPPEKLSQVKNRHVAIRGSSLTAIDAIRTLALANGHFVDASNNRKLYIVNDGCENFKITLHSRNGLLPAVRFHLEDSHLSKDSVLPEQEVKTIRAANGGFLPLDYVFKRNFLEGIQEHRPELYELIKDLSLEDFVELMMIRREDTPPFKLLEFEFDEAERSIALKRSVYWKEMLAVLSFAMNYPAKYFSAEDMLRLQKTLMPLISVVIAFAPQDSVAELMAMHHAGVLGLLSVGEKSFVSDIKTGGIVYHFKDSNDKHVNLEYDTFIDCIGQVHLEWDQIPFPSLVTNGTISPAKLKFQYPVDIQNNDSIAGKVNKERDGSYSLQVKGIAINDHFQVLNANNEVNNRLYVMAVPFIGGLNPDYSGLDFSEAASARIVEKMLNANQQAQSTVTC